MKKLVLTSVAGLLVGCATTSADLPTQSGVDLQKYAGTWYEQARLPMRFQKDCAGDVQADYRVLDDARIAVTNQCRTKDGSQKVAEGEARLAGKAESPDTSKLQVRFAPDWISWLPSVWGDYWILKLDENYQYSLVGTPDRDYLWVLSREKQADPATVESLLKYASSLGYDISKVIQQPSTSGTRS